MDARATQASVPAPVRCSRSKRVLSNAEPVGAALMVMIGHPLRRFTGPNTQESVLLQSDTVCSPGVAGAIGRMDSLGLAIRHSQMANSVDARYRRMLSPDNSRRRPGLQTMNLRPFNSQPFARSQRAGLGYSGAGGRFPAISGMPVSPIVQTIGSDGRATTRRAGSALLRRRLIVRLSAAAEATTGSELDSPSSRVLHELSGLAPYLRLRAP